MSEWTSWLELVNATAHTSIPKMRVRMLHLPFYKNLQKGFVNRNLHLLAGAETKALRVDDAQDVIRLAQHNRPTRQSDAEGVHLIIADSIKCAPLNTSLFFWFPKQTDLPFGKNFLYVSHKPRD